METLAKLFGSEVKVKIMRLFLASPERMFDLAEIAVRVKSDASKVRRELSNLEKMGMIKRRASKMFIVNPQFGYLKQLQNFLINVEPLQPKEIVRKISRVGSIKLIIVAGVFIQDAESRLDILVVGDNVKKVALENSIKLIESEVGRELRYAHFTTEDFKYRLSMFDKLIRDILDYPHRQVLNRLGVL